MFFQFLPWSVTGYHLYKQTKMGQSSSDFNEKILQKQSNQLTLKRKEVKFCKPFKIQPRDQEDYDIPDFEEDFKEEKKPQLLNKTTPSNAKRVKTKLFMSRNHKKSRFSQQVQTKHFTKPLLRWNQFRIEKKNRSFYGSYLIHSELQFEQKSGKNYKVFLKTGKIERFAKIFKREELDKNKETEIFQQITNLTKIDHPNISRLLEVYISEKEIILFKAQKKINFSEKKIQKIIKQLLKAISYLHNQGISHRNIQLKNIYLDDDCDFLKLVEFSRIKLLKKQKCNGSGTYQSIEQNEIIDIWSIGTILYMLMFGYQPFQGLKISEILSYIQNSITQKEQKSYFSKDCFDLLHHLIQRKLTHRFNAKKALQHQWLINLNKRQKVRKIFKQLCIENFKKFKQKNPLAIFIKTYIVSQLASNEERNQFLPLFDEMDVKNKGVIDFSQFRYGLTGKTKMDSQSESIRQLFKSLDTNQTGNLQFTEFIVGVGTFEKKNLQKYLQTIFFLLDQKEYGQIDFESIKKYLGENTQVFRNWFYLTTGQSGILTKNKFMEAFSNI